MQPSESRNRGLKDCATRPPAVRRAGPGGEADPPASPAREQWRAGDGQAFFRCKQLYALGNKLLTNIVHKVRCFCKIYQGAFWPKWRNW